MGFTAVKCPSCGANVELDDSRDFGFCTYCGAKIVQDKIIVEHRGSVTIEGTATKETLLERAKIMLRDGDFTGADKTYDRVLDIDPHCAAAYFGRELCAIGVRGEAGLANYNRSILNDGFYLQALDFAAEDERKRYEDLGELTRDNQMQKERNTRRSSLYSAYLRARKHVILGYVLPTVLWFAVTFPISYFSMKDEEGAGAIIGLAIFTGVILSLVSALIASLILIKDFKAIRKYKREFDL